MEKNMTCFHRLPKVSTEDLKALTDKCLNQQTWFRAHEDGLRPGDTAYREGKNYTNNVEADYVYYHDDWVEEYANKIIPAALKNDVLAIVLTKLEKGQEISPHIDQGREAMICLAVWPQYDDYQPTTYYYNNDLVFLDNYNIGVPALCNLKILHSAKNFTDHNRYNLQIGFKVPYEELLSKITTKDVG
jgi:hypothetical protein|tara:strand:- start:1020 stop:1583 length:564 start_codon:yes stop_codon:yes gene_type:complete